MTLSSSRFVAISILLFAFTAGVGGAFAGSPGIDPIEAKCTAVRNAIAQKLDSVAPIRQAMGNEQAALLALTAVDFVFMEKSLSGVSTFEEFFKKLQELFPKLAKRDFLTFSNNFYQTVLRQWVGAGKFELPLLTNLLEKYGTLGDGIQVQKVFSQDLNGYLVRVTQLKDGINHVLFQSPVTVFDISDRPMQLTLDKGTDEFAKKFAPKFQQMVANALQNSSTRPDTIRQLLKYFLQPGTAFIFNMGSMRAFGILARAATMSAIQQFLRASWRTKLGAGAAIGLVTWGLYEYFHDDQRSKVEDKIVALENTYGLTIPRDSAFYIRIPEILETKNFEVAKQLISQAKCENEVPVLAMFYDVAYLYGNNG